MACRKVKIKDVKAAYQKTGLTPAQNVFCYDGEACAFGALHAANKRASGDPGDWSETRYGRGYQTGFIRGFDSHTGKFGRVKRSLKKTFSSQPHALRRAMEGLRDGWRVNQAIFGSKNIGNQKKAV